VSASINTLIPEFQPYARDLVDVAGQAGLQPRVTSTRRSHTEQQRLYRRFTSGLSALPVAPPGHSAHEFGYAMDLICTPFESLTDLGYTWQQAGGIWGGEFNDPVHFEYPGFKAAVQPAPQTGITIDDVKDFIATLPIPISATLVLSLADHFAPSTIVDMILNPSKAVKRYPWLRALGPPFMFY